MAAVTPPPPTLPRGPRGSPLTGHAAEWNRDPLAFLTRCAREHGDAVPIRLGPVRFVVLSRPDLVEQVLVTDQRSFGKGSSHRLTRSLLGNGLLSSEGELWLRQRRLAQPAFHRERVAAYAGTMVAYTERALATWRDGEVRDVHQKMMRLTLQIAAKTLFNTDVAEEASAAGATVDAVGFGGALTRALERFDGRTSTLVLMLPVALPLPGNLRFTRALRDLDRTVYGIIDRRRHHATEEADPGDLLSLLLRARDDAGAGMTDRQLRDETITLLFAGHETAALALTWAWYLLALHPEAEARLFAEVDGVLGERSPTVADLPRLTYARRVIDESLRLYPPAPAVVASPPATRRSATSSPCWRRSCCWPPLRGATVSRSCLGSA